MVILTCSGCAVQPTSEDVTTEEADTLYQNSDLYGDERAQSLASPGDQSNRNERVTHALLAGIAKGDIDR